MVSIRSLDEIDTGYTLLSAFFSSGGSSQYTSTYCDSRYPGWPGLSEFLDCRIRDGRGEGAQLITCCGGSQQ
jgi:hypothetical protein